MQFHFNQWLMAAAILCRFTIFVSLQVSISASCNQYPNSTKKFCLYIYKAITISLFILQILILSSMATSNTAIKSFKWFANKSSLRLSLPLFRPKSKSSPTLSSNNSWPRKSSKADELEQVFCFFDENKDGKISGEELRAYFMSIGDSVSHEEAERVINEFDRDGDNLLEFGDFVQLIEQDDHRDDYIKKAFEMFEVEKGSGCITPKGLQQVFKLLGTAKSFEECKAMIGAYDLDGNGVLDFNEFQSMMS